VRSDEHGENVLAAQQEPQRSSLADPTRDIRLPPLPGTPPPAVPPEWEGAIPQRTPEPDPALAASSPSEPEPDASLADQPTDQLTSPRRKDRDPTLTFDGSARERWAAGLAATPDPAWSSVPVPAPVVAPRDRSRRWPWIVLALVPLVVIVGTGVWLLLLMQG
jgi:hypothetical protein